MNAAVVIDNNTDASVDIRACLDGPHVAVLLGNDSIRPQVAWPAVACLMRQISLPPGRTTYPVSVRATYARCDPNFDFGPNKLPRCLSGGRMPPLPPGDYRATFFQDQSDLPVPAPVAVRVRR